MQQLPKGIERPFETGIFFIRDYGGSHAVVVLANVLVTCGGENAKEMANAFASRLNRAWNQQFDEERRDK